MVALCQQMGKGSASRRRQPHHTLPQGRADLQQQQQRHCDLHQGARCEARVPPRRRQPHLAEALAHSGRLWWRPLRWCQGATATAGPGESTLSQPQGKIALAFQLDASLWCSCHRSTLPRSREQGILTWKSIVCLSVCVCASVEPPPTPKGSVVMDHFKKFHKVKPQQEAKPLPEVKPQQVSNSPPRYPEFTTLRKPPFFCLLGFLHGSRMLVPQHIHRHLLQSYSHRLFRRPDQSGRSTATVS